MPLPTSTSLATRKRTRSSNVTENLTDPHTTNSHTSFASSSTTATLNISTRTAQTMPANAPPKRQRNNPPPPMPSPPVRPRTNYSFRNRSITPDPRHPATRFPSLNTSSTSSSLTTSRIATATTTGQRYNLRSRRPQSQIRLPQVPTPHPTAAPRRPRRPAPSMTPSISSSNSSSITGLQSTPLIVPPLPPPPPPPMPSLSFPIPPMIQPRQYRLVYISDDDDDLPTSGLGTATLLNTTLNLVTDDEDDEYTISSRPTTIRRQTTRSISGAGLNTRSFRTSTNPASALSTSSSSSSSSSNSTNSLTTINTQDFMTGVAHVRLNRAIEIVIDSIQSLEGAVNNFDQLVFSLIYGRLDSRSELESIEGMIRLSRILSLTLPARLSQEEIDALPKIVFEKKSNGNASVLLAEKCPICLTEFDDQERINKLHCSHLFHLQCISTWLSENDSCPTCRRKVMGD